MSGFFAELRRRNVIRMAGLYLVGAWLMVQVAETLLPVFGAPGWVLKVLVMLLALGFVPALVFAWVFELTPDGLRRDADVEPGQSIAPQTARRMDRMIFAGLLALIALVAIDRFWPREERGSESLSGTNTVGTGDSRAPESDSDPLSGPLPKSIGVLAFADMSPGHDNEYLADGIAEEILNALAKVRELKVAGRTSSFHFKGRNESLKKIGEELGVAHVLEGSVRRQGERVRITAQLIQASDGFHVWSETYDGDLADVFALQERIARAITEELKVVLSGAQQQRLVDAGTGDADAYALYLEAAAIFNRRESARYAEAIALLEKSLALDPRFARAASRMAILQTESRSSEQSGELVAKARANAERALALDPTLAEPHLALALMARRERRFLDSRAAIERALTLEPDDASVNFFVGQNRMATGYTDSGTEFLDRALLIDPLHPNALWRRAIQYLDVRDVGAAERAFSRSIEMGLSWADEGPVLLAEARGDFARARELSAARPLPVADPCLKDSAPAWRAYRDGVIGGSAAERARALAVIEDCIAARPVPLPSWVAIGFMKLDAPERALHAILAGPSSSENSVFNHLWGPGGRGARRSPGFPMFAREIGLTALWDVHGPPDLCVRNAAGDYACE